eukprot:1081562-Rhodomonas_salina.2
MGRKRCFCNGSAVEKTARAPVCARRQSSGSGTSRPSQYWRWYQQIELWYQVSTGTGTSIQPRKYWLWCKHRTKQAVRAQYAIRVGT